MRRLAPLPLLVGLCAIGCNDNTSTPTTTPPTRAPANGHAPAPAAVTTPPKPLELTAEQKKVIGKWESDNGVSKSKWEFTPYGSFFGTVKIGEQSESPLWLGPAEFRFLDDKTLQVSHGGGGGAKETWKI